MNGKWRFEIEYFYFLLLFLFIFKFCFVFIYICSKRVYMSSCYTSSYRLRWVFFFSRRKKNIKIRTTTISWKIYKYMYLWVTEIYIIFMHGKSYIAWKLQCDMPYSHGKWLGKIIAAIFYLFIVFTCSNIVDYNN